MNAFTSLLTKLLLLLSALAIPMSLAAQDKQDHRPVRYSLTVLGTLGGTFSAAVGLNNKGSIASEASLTGDFLRHASIWRKGVITDLGSLGVNSFTPVANHTLNERDTVVGYSETSTPDPNGDDLCMYNDFLICLPFVWQDGVLIALPTLGGNNGNAYGINNRGQIVGQAETPNSDPCSPFAQQVEAVIWEHGVVEEILPPFGGTAAVGNAINDNGDVVGLSGCVTGNFYAVLWEHGTPINLGSLGGLANNIPFDINNKGQIVGQSDLPGDTTHHAFLWQNGVMTDLGALPGLPVSVANAINNQGQIVGFSENSVNTVALLWQDGVMTDLNTLIPADSPWFLVEALGINDRGEITGYALNTSTGEFHGYVLTPIEDSESSASVARSAAIRKPPVIPEEVRQMLKREMMARQHWSAPPG